LLSVIRRHLKTDRKETLRIAEDTLVDCGLTDTRRILGSYPHEISGGMRQRVMIAMALSCQPKVIIADEPTSALDISSRDQVLALLFQAARKRQTAVLFISHDLAAVARICDRIMVMYSGRVVESGETVQVLGQPRHPYTAALLAATPKISTGRPVPVRPIPGSASPQLSLPAACSFSGRCGFASELCSKQLPELKSHGEPVRTVACHHPLAGDVA
jgi:oligopeptide/dipeptide ABC transporter ATP-binding protein